MNNQTEKLDLIEWNSRLKYTSVVDKLIQIKEDHSKSSVWSDNLEKEELGSINRGLKDFEEWRIHTHETVRKIYER